KAEDKFEILFAMGFEVLCGGNGLPYTWGLDNMLNNVLGL
ncbi:hypothetical protein NPIL_511721, partial [Nephila pilipes]